MNLLAKIRIFGALILGLIIFNSCEENGAFGIGTDDVAPVEFVTEDINLQTSVVLLDSVRSNGLGRMLVGNRSTPSGDVVATGYMGLSLNSLLLPELTEESILDSVHLVFRVNYLYDTTPANTNLDLQLYQIGELYKDTSYITTNSLMNSGILLGQGQNQISDLDTTYIVEIDKNWGQVIFDGIRDDVSTFTNQPEFVEYFPGFILSTPTNQNNIFGISPGTDFEVLFYYSEPVEAGSEELSNVVITMNGTGMPSFHNLNVNRGPTEFNSINTTGVEFDDFPNRAVQSGAGLLTKLNLSDLERFSEENTGAIVNLAELKIGPVQDLEEGVAPPPSILIFITDQENTLIRDGNSFRGIQQDGVPILGQGVPLQLFYDADTKTYETTMTSYVQAYVANAYRINEVFLYPTFFNTSVNGFVVDPSNIELKIFYSELR